MSDNPMMLFGQNVPGVYRLSDVYKYNFGNGTVDNSQTGTMVPSKDSVVVDDTLGQGNIKFYTVTAVDNSGADPTYEALLQEVSNNLQKTHHMDNFGNSLLVLYYETAGYTVNSKDYTRVIVDRKLSVFSPDAEYYVVTDQDGNIISIDPNDLTDPPGDGQVALTDDPDTGKKLFRDCAVDPDERVIHDGDHLTLRVFDENDIQLTELVLICRSAKGVGSLSVPNNVLVDMKLLWQGSEVTDNIPLQVGNDAESLDLSVKLIYGDGTEEEQVINNEDCLVYGLDHIHAITEHVGDVYPFIVKYYLAKGRKARVYGHVSSERFLTVRGRVEIVS